jgi:hypothetical protein
MNKIPMSMAIALLLSILLASATFAAPATSGTPGHAADRTLRQHQSGRDMDSAGRQWAADGPKLPRWLQLSDGRRPGFAGRWGK